MGIYTRTRMKRIIFYLSAFTLFLTFVHKTYADAVTNSEKNLSFFEGLKTPPAPQQINERDEVEINVFPNPVVDNAVIKIITAGKHISSLVISDAIGNRITTLNLSSQDPTIIRYHNFSDLRPGIYFCSVYADADIMNTTKIVKQ